MYHGSCTIREFGKYTSFVAPSTRLGRETVRLKFSASTALMNRIKYDEYLIKNLPVKANHTFSEKNEEICKDKKHQRRENFKARSIAEKLGKEKTDQYIAREELMDLLKEED